MRSQVRGMYKGVSTQQCTQNTLKMACIKTSMYIHKNDFMKSFLVKGVTQLIFHFTKLQSESGVVPAVCTPDIPLLNGKQY